MIKSVKTGVLLGLMAVFLFSCGSKKEDGSQDNMFAIFKSGPDYDVNELNSIFTSQWVDSASAMKKIQATKVMEELAVPMYRFYKDRGFQVAWIEEDGPNENAEELLEALSKAEEEGLNSEDYRLQYLYHLKERAENEEESLSPQELLELDQALTAAYLQFANHMLQGRMEPEMLDTLWLVNSREADLAENLKRALKESSIAEELAALEPNYPEYEGLKKALAIYTRLKEKQPEWPALPQELVLKPGDSSRYVAQLRKRLHITGEYTGDTVLNDSLANYYDASLAEAVADYQQLNGLEVDSIVAGETLGMLNIPVDKRLKQIRLNLERLRWMPERPKGRHIRVNVPEYKLYVYEGEEEVMNMRVVVGKAYESYTPIFNDSIEYISFSPTWTVPNSIATEEMLPKIMKDPDFLSRNGYSLYEGWEEDAPEIDPRDVDWEEVDTTDFPYRIVQNPGGSNALGQMKFMFPNNLSIYLHDTPAGHLFENTERDYSHGCVRIEKPMDLAEYLLEGKGWRKSEIQQHLDLEEPENVVLPEKVPVFIEYRTAWLDEEGKVNFREDIYGHDSRQSEQLERLLSEAYNEALLALQARYQ